MKRYKITLPTPQRALELGIKFEGQETRTRLWLMGVASGVAFMSEHVPMEREQVRFNVAFSNRNSFYVDTNSGGVMAQVNDHLTEYGCTITREFQSSLPQGSAIPYNHTASLAQKA